MSTNPFDSTRYKMQQRQDWDNVASGWRTWWETFERGAQALSDHLIALAHVEPGQRVLDIATGIGEPAVTAARRVGPGGYILAIDQSPQMLAIAWERAAALGLQNIKFRELDAEQLNLLEDGFDAVLCRWGLMFLPHLVPTLESIRQQLRTGGRFATAVWPAAAKVPLMSLPMAVISEYIQVPSPPPGTPGPFRCADSSALEQTLTQAGFREVRSEAMILAFEFASASDYTQYMQAVSPPIHAMLASQSAEQQERIWQAIRDTVHQRYGSADNTIHVPNETICVVGRR